MLYSHKGHYPKPLPFRIKLPNGQTRTDPASFTPEEIEAAGLVAVADPPAVQHPDKLEWTGTDWLVRPLNEYELLVLSRRVEEQRKAAYEKEADPLFFKWQRGEGTQEAWLAKIEEIKLRYPDTTQQG